MGRYQYSLIAILILLIPVPETYAVNWLMLQGTEPANVSHLPFLFIQPSYTKDLSSEISLGPNADKRAVNTTIAPNFDNDQELQLRRARAGVRGNFTGALKNDFTSKMNYFFLGEFAPNLLTYEFLGERERLMGLDHFSLTFNHIEGARVRIGLFKTPGLEETFQGIATQDYIEFTDFAAREIIERFADGNRRASPVGGTNGVIGTPTKIGSDVNAVRDWGVMVFDSFKIDSWDYSYSLMLGRGAGINQSDRPQDSLEQYYYLSAEQDLTGGKGARKHGVKYYLWYQDGEREFNTDPSATEYDRKRYGIGVRAQGKLFGLDARQRLDVALSYADGMIFVAPAGSVKGDASTLVAGDLMFAAEEGNKSRALSIDYSYFITPKFETMLRYDQHELLYETNDSIWAEGDARDIQTLTFGAQYHLTPKMRFTFNYIDRNVDAPNTKHPAIENVINSVRDRYSIQFTYIY